jgi:Ser/Thr protein kinase RdoA (MazF antagonist)
MSCGVAVEGRAALDRALAASDGPGPVAEFLDAVAPDEVLAAVRRCLPPGHPGVLLQLVRAKLKPGRKLTVEYGVGLAGGRERRICVTWVVAGATAPGPAADGEAEARRRGVLAPFSRAWVVSDDGRMSACLAPVDGAFPQLARGHDRVHLAGVLRAAGGAAGLGDLAAADLTVDAVRYRPGQRHVLRIGVGGSGPAWFAKVYRDDTGRRAVAAAAWTTTALAAGGAVPVAARRAAGRYLAADRVAVWPAVPGSSLAAPIAASGSAAGDVVRAAGSALRQLHDAPSAAELPACPDAVGQACATLRTAELLDVLAPPVGVLLRREVGRALELLATLPPEPATVTHGDFKSDNLLVSGSRVHLLDFDRFGRGDPAADVGNFLADLRWWSDGDGPEAAGLHRAFLDGYGGEPPARMARARVYDGLSQLRMAARRVPIQDPDWDRRVTGAVGVAAATLSGAR